MILRSTESIADQTAIFVQDDGKIVHQKESERVSFRPNRGRPPGGGSTSHPFGSLAIPNRFGVHSFASSPRGEFAFVEDEEAKTWIITTHKR